MATGGWEVSCCFSKTLPDRGYFFIVLPIINNMEIENKDIQHIEENQLPDLTSPEAARQMFLASEIFNRKY